MRGRLAIAVAHTAGVIALLVVAACAHTPVGTAPKEIRSLLVGGTWARHLDDHRFHADGTFESYERGRNDPTRGTWRLQGTELSLTAEHETTRYRILTITSAKLEMTFGSAGQHLRYTRFPAPATGIDPEAR